MELALSGLQWSLCLIYLDDVIVFSEDFDEQVDPILIRCSHIGSVGLKLKPSKCVFFVTKVSFLGHNLSKKGILPDPENVAKILNWPVPKTVCDVRGILGLGCYYHRFIRNFSERVQPLVNLTKKDKPFKWTEECQLAFEDIKQVLISPDTMAFPTDDGQFILDSKTIPCSDHTKPGYSVNQSPLSILQISNQALQTSNNMTIGRSVAMASLQMPRVSRGPRRMMARRRRMQEDQGSELSVQRHLK